MGDQQRMTRGERTREEILAAATEAALAAGTGDVSLREVARRAGLVPSALYNHFPDKEALIAAVAMRALGGLSSHLGAIPDDQPASRRLEMLADAYLRYAAERPAEYRLIFDCLENPPVPWEHYLQVAEPFTLIVRACADGVRAGEFTSGVDPGAMAYALWSLCHGHASLTSRALARVEGEFDTMAADAVVTLIRGYTKEL